jgi:alpha-tubulin suppressor-like RCC1 family protein
MRRSLPWLALSIISLFLLTCTGQQPNPFQQSDANITPALENSFGQTSDSAISDTVGNRISIGIRPYLASFIDSVRVVVHSGSTTDTSFTFGKNSDWANNPRIVVPFRSVGTRVASFTVFISSSEKFDSATVKILPRAINITTKSSNDSVTQNDSITFAAGVSDTGLHTFQWYKDTTILSGATQATLTINPVVASSAGSYTCLIRDQYGDTARTPAAILTVKQPVIPNRRPVLEVTGLRNITVAQTCSLSLSAQDSDAGQTQVFSLVKGPQGGTLTGPTFKWAPPSGFTGIDTIVFAVTDNGTPPLSDTVPVYITVSESLSLQIITPLPAATSVVPGSSTALTVVAGGSAPIAYQWYYNGTAISGATANSYSKTWGASDGGIYKVVVSNAGGKDSSATQVTVCPRITAGLGPNTSIVISSSSALSVTATGTAPLTYQWYVNGTAITGATTNSYSKTWASVDGGVYKVVVTNGAGSDSSQTTVTINSSITTPLSGTTNITQGNTTALTVAASGTPPITYQWYYNGTAITGATGASYSKTWGGSDGGIYKVVVTNPTGTDSSSTQVTVNPVITTGLSASTSVGQGSSTALSVVVTGTSPITYQWYYNGTAITGAATNSYSKTWGATDGGIYKVVVSNAAGKDSSSTQLGVSPKITAGLGATTSIATGSQTTLSVTAGGTATLSYQWYYNGTAITAATNASYSKNWTASDGGVYKVIVTNVAGSDSSKTTVTINSSITTPLPGTTNVVQGSTTPLTIVASGTPPITYQWYYNGTAITSAISASYSKTWGAADGGVYKVVVTNPTGTDSSSTQLAVSPVITAGLSAGTSVTQAGSTALSVTASGTATITYQWFFNGTAITAATANSYSKTWGAADGGTYKVVATNAAGKDSSTTQVTVSPLITAGLGANTSISINSTTALSVTAAGTATLAYQWYLNGTAITGATSNSYSKTWGATDGGVYKVVVTNAAGSDSSKTTVTINSSITTPLPGTTNVVQGSTTPLTIVASGTPPITYQWYYNGTAITGATSASYSKTWGAADGGVYKVVVTNPTGKDSSSTQLAVASTAPTGASANPTAICSGGSSSLSVIGGFLGTGASWKWYTDAGCTTPVLGTNTGTPITVSPTSTTTYYVRAEGTVNNTATAGVVVTMNTNASAAVTPATTPVAICPSGSIQFTCTPSGTGPFTYQWTNGGIAISGATSSTLAATAAGTYACSVTGACGGATSSNAVVVTVNTSASAAVTPATTPVAICPSGSIQFTCTPSGTGPFTYQWTNGGITISGATSSTLAATAAGTYVCSVTGACGGATASNAVVVSMNTTSTAPSGATAGSAKINAGSSTTVSVTGGSLGTGASWKWYTNAGCTTPVSGTNTGASISVTPATTTTYYVRAEGTCGNTATASVTVTAVRVIQISAAVSHTLFVKSDSTLWACGGDYDGELCDNGSTEQNTPIKITNNVIAAAAGGNGSSGEFSLYLTSNGNLYGCGANDHGQLGTGSTGTQSYVTLIAPGVRTMAAGVTHILFIKTDGTVWACGSNSYGELGNSSTKDTAKPVEIAQNGQSVAAGEDFSLLLSTTGTLYAFGNNGDGELGTGTTSYSADSVPTPISISNVVSISASYQQSFAIKSDGTVWAWGFDYAGMLGTGGSASTANPTPVQMFNVSNAAAVSSGDTHTLIVTNAQALWATGDDAEGELCDSSTTMERSPINPIKSGVQLAVANRESASFVVKTDGTVWACGYNNSGQLGNGNTNDPPSLVKISGASTGF